MNDIQPTVGLLKPIINKERKKYKENKKKSKSCSLDGERDRVKNGYRLPGIKIQNEKIFLGVPAKTRDLLVADDLHRAQDHS